MPHTVPKSPTKGAVAPTEASTVRPLSSRACAATVDCCSVRPMNSLALTAIPIPPADLSSHACAACTASAATSANAPVGSRARIASSAWAREPASQNAFIASVPEARARNCPMALPTMMYQVATDISSKTIATPCATVSDCAQKWASPSGWFINDPCRWLDCNSAAGCGRRRSAWAGSLQAKHDWHDHAAGDRLVATTCGHEAPLAYRAQRSLVETGKTAALLDLDVLGIATN